MLDFFQAKQHRVVFSILAGLVGIIMVMYIIFGISMIIKGGSPKSENMYRSISFSGEGKIYTKPDIAMVTLSVVTNGKTVADVQEKNTEKINKVIEFLKKFGIEDKDIKTTNYNLYPQYNYYPYGKTPQITGYEITQSLETKIRNLDKVGEVIEGSVTAGVNQIFSLYFKVDKDEEFKSQAKELAIKDAKKKAEETAKQLGVRLGKLIGYSEGGDYYPIYSNYKGVDGIGGGGESAPNIQIGENEILMTVTLTYEIK